MYKQPRVPEFDGASSLNIPAFLRRMVLFLKEFCIQAWRWDKNVEKRLENQHPVGSIFLSAASDANPAKLFGGSWESVLTGIQGVSGWKRTA